MNKMLIPVLWAGLTAVAGAQTIGQWRFEEGSFHAGHGPDSRSVMDDSGLHNHGFSPDPDGRLSYTEDAFGGRWALDFNNPNDLRPNPGMIKIPHSAMLEPSLGQVEAWIKFEDFHDAVLFTMPSFQWLRSEAGPEPPVYEDSEQPGLVSRVAYQLRISKQGRAMAVIGNDGMDPTPHNGGTPWTTAVSSNDLRPGGWNFVAMRWTSCTLQVHVNGKWSRPVWYESIAGAGLSYCGRGIDPVLGPMKCDFLINDLKESFVGQMDCVRLLSGEQCDPGFIGRMDYPRR